MSATITLINLRPWRKRSPLQDFFRDLRSKPGQDVCLVGSLLITLGGFHLAIALGKTQSYPNAAFFNDSAISLSH
ncbi:hypothetical protein [Ochrobactrum teleogrylli]